MGARLPRSFFERHVVTVARALLGQKLVRVEEGKRTAGIIVETEAYLGLPDKAAHTFNGRRTKRNASMWGPGGTAYVYFTYGMHYCMNVVAGQAEQPVAVLVRAVEPAEGIERMYARRAGAQRDTDLCSGPAKLTQAMAIDRRQDGVDLVTGRGLFIERLRKRALPGRLIGISARIGVGYAEQWADRPLRFFIAENRFVGRNSGQRT